MPRQHLPHQPTLRQLLSSESMAEAQVVHGEDLLDEPVLQVVTSLTPPPRAGSLYVARAGALANQNAGSLRDLAGVVVIRAYLVPAESPAAAASHGAAGALAPVSLDLELQGLVKLCAEAEVPLLIVPGFGEPAQAAEDIRLAFLAELRRASARIYARLLSLVVEEGLPGLIEEVSSWLGRPLSVETADFKVLGAKNMGPTPPSQQRVITEQVAETINRQLRLSEKQDLVDLIRRPFRIGRRLVMPVVLNDVVVGYVCAMTRPTDDLEMLTEYLYPAALAAMVDFSQRQREVSAFTVTQKTLLKDLLAGRGLSAADQERLDQNFGFDLCDGLVVFAVQAIFGPSGRQPQWPDEPYASTDLEGTRAFVVPLNHKSGRTWQQEADLLAEMLKRNVPDVKVQIGTGRPVESTLDLPDSYREARQALIIGSMIHGDKEFLLSYGELGVKRLLYLMIDHPELDRFYEENLAPLEAYDAEWETELVPTLEVYLKEGANLNSAARALFIHRHTLRYRLEQIAEILNVDIDSQEVLLNLQIAFLIKEMKGKSQP